jgi:hypothetical protein
VPHSSTSISGQPLHFHLRRCHPHPAGQAALLSARSGGGRLFQPRQGGGEHLFLQRTAAAGLIGGSAGMDTVGNRSRRPSFPMHQRGARPLSSGGGTHMDVVADMCCGGTSKNMVSADSTLLLPSPVWGSAFSGGGGADTTADMRGGSGLGGPQHRALLDLGIRLGGPLGSPGYFF